MYIKFFNYFLKTPELLPDCHPMPIEYTDVYYEIEGLLIRILVTVKTIYKTGVEVEAMHGASVVALNMYDMLKPIDKSIEIQQIKLIEKKGGKSSLKVKIPDGFRASVVVCSDSISKGEKEDGAGKAIVSKLEKLGVAVKDVITRPDEVDKIRFVLNEQLSQETDLVIFTGGTGMSPNDVTPEAIIPLLDKRIEGVEETLRAYGQLRMPYAMLSRSVAGTIGKTLILALPGSTNGAKEGIDALFPHILHVFHVLKGGRHD
jgi:molybdenum cofactor synthesis domain-containing protein